MYPFSRPVLPKAERNMEKCNQDQPRQHFLGVALLGDFSAKLGLYPGDAMEQTHGTS